MDLLSIISKNLPLAPRGQAYSEQLQAIGGTPAYSWTLVSGALPTGVSLSSSGLLSAALGAIPEAAVGVHTFDVQVEDTVPDTDVVSLSIEVVPYGFDRITEFLLDTRLKDLVGNLLLDEVTREKVEKHFFRGTLGDPGQTISHLDRDILSEDWPVPDTDKTLREVLELLDLATKEAIKTVNTVEPVPATQDFGLAAGLGITITPIANGLQISGEGLQKIEKLEATGAPVPGDTLDLASPTYPHLFTAQIETESGMWYPVDDIPAFAGKKLGQTIASGCGGVLAFAVGEISGVPKVHVLWEDGVNIKLSRFDGLTLAHEETWSMATASPLVGEPLVMIENSGKVIVSWCDANDDIWYGVFNQADYTDTTTPAYLNPPVLNAALNPATPPIGTNRLIGAVPPAGSAGDLCYIGFDKSGVPTVGEFNTLTPGTTGYTGTSGTGPAGGSWIDMIVDSTVPNLLVLGVDGFGGPSDNLSLWQAALAPFTGGAMAVSVLDGPVADGTFFQDGMILIDESPAGGAVRAVTIPYIYVDGEAISNFGNLKMVWQDTVETWPIVPLPISKTTGWTRDTQAVRSVFVKAWNSAGEAKCDGYLVDHVLSHTNDVVMRRIHFAPNTGVVEDETVSALLKTDLSWLCGGHTSENTSNAWQPRIFTSDDVFSSVSETFNEKTLNLHYDSAQKKLILANDSAFTWNAKIEAVILGGDDYPTNLMIPCYQLAQALKNYFDDAGFYPSPSTSGGVTWSETQLASADTSGYTFSTYYSVVPGTYDMHGGTVAQAFYYADEAAGLASDQTVVFRYAPMPTEVLAAEVVIAADITANLPLTHPSAGGAANPNFYTLAELDAKLSSSYATTYSGPPFDYYRYFCFLNNAGTAFHQGWFSQNYVDTHLAYGPHAVTTPTIPTQEHFIQAADAVQGVPTLFTLANPVATAHMYINGLRYFRDVDWVFGAGMHEISYLNRAGTPNNPGYTLHQYDEIAFDKYML